MWYEEADRLAEEVRTRFPQLSCVYVVSIDMFLIGVGEYWVAKVPGRFRDKLMSIAESIAD